MQDPVTAIIFEYTDSKQGKKQCSFDPKILDFNIEFLNNNHSEPYPIPSQIASSSLPFQIMQQFLTAHQFNPLSVKIVKPIRSSNFEVTVDPTTFKLFEKYTQGNNAQQANEVLRLSRYIRFHQLCDGVSAAIATSFYIDEDEKSLEDFIKKNELEEINADHMCEFIKEYQSIFTLINCKFKKEFQKIQEQAEHS